MSYHLCPVCGYKKMTHPPNDYYICPCCGTEFEADDFEVSHSRLRQKWQDNKMQWFSRRTPKPYDYNPELQLRNLLGFKGRAETLNTVSKTDFDLKIESKRYGNITTSGRTFVFGAPSENLGVVTG
ncbi:MAG: hypothetical protein ACR2HT_03400 [Pyrinomonadaceae bacterium]